MNRFFVGDRFINAFKIYYGKQRDYYEKEKQKMKTGVQKLFEAAEQVQEITQELIAKEKHMAIANSEAATVGEDVFFFTRSNGDFDVLFSRKYQKWKYYAVQQK